MLETNVIVADHELIALIGKGSYGEVWLAKSCTGRFRAVKIVLRERFKTSGPFERELSGIRQFEPVSRSHEGLIDVLHVGEDRSRGCFYYVMEAADDVFTGSEINPANYCPKMLGDEIQKRKRLPASECIQIGISLARALAHLHEKKLVHRDIKPSNIVYVNGSIKLADIGLVTNFANAASYVGTEGFIPPDGPGTEQADIFALGKVLYEAATGRDRQEFPGLPDPLADKGDESEFQELNEIILKACHPSTAQRYRTAKELLRDLAALEGGQSVRRLRTLEKRFKVLRRAALVALLVLSLILAIFLPAYHARKLLNQTRQEQRGSLLANATRDMEAGNYIASLPKFAAALRLDLDDKRRVKAHRLRIGSILSFCPTLSDMEFLDGEVSCVDLSSDGKTILAVKRGECAYILSSSKPRKIRRLPVQSITFATFSPDGTLIATSNLGGTVSIWSANTLENLRDIPHPKALEAVRFSYDGRFLVSACSDGGARIFSVKTGALTKQFQKNSQKLTYAEFNRTGSAVVTASTDATAQVWNFETGEAVGESMLHKSWVMYATFSPDGKRVATTSYDRTALIWDADTGNKMSFAMEHNDSVAAAAFSLDGSQLATAGLDGSLRLWNGFTGQPLKSNAVLKHSSRVEHLVYAPDGRLITGCLDGSIRVWDFMPKGIGMREFDGVLSGDGTTGAKFQGGQFEVFDVVNGQKISTIPAMKWISDLALNENGTLVAAMVSTPEKTNVASAWNAKTGQNIYTSAAEQFKNLRDIQLSASGERIAFWEQSRIAVINRKDQRKMVSQVLPEGRALMRFDQKADSVFVAVDSYLLQWDISTNAAFKFVSSNLPPDLSFVEVQPDGKRIMTGFRDDSYQQMAALAFDVQKHSQVGGPLQHRDGVVCGAFSRLGDYMATAGEEFNVIVWKPGQSAPISILPHTDRLLSLAFNHDASLLLSLSLDKRLRVWNPLSGELLSPPISMPESGVRANFLGDSDDILVVGKRKSWLYKLKRDQRPLEDIELFAKLLSSDWPATAGVSSLPLKAAWEALLQDYPKD